MKKAAFLNLFIILLFSHHGNAQIYQGGGGIGGKIEAVEACSEKDPTVHKSSFALHKKNADSCKSDHAKCRVSFDGEQTEWRGPDTAIRTIDFSCYYNNMDFTNANATCDSRTEFSSIAYSSALILPPFAKPLWNLTLDISYSGERFLNENVFVRVEVADDSSSSKSITSLILPCDDQNSFSGISPGEIVDMEPGNYSLKISQPDYVAANDKANSILHKEGKLFIKYRVMITGHN